MWRWLNALGADRRQRESAGRYGVRVLPGGCNSGSSLGGKDLMFSRAYRSAISLPPLLWVAVFLLLPYALLLCYSFWSVSPSQTIVHAWALDNYHELFRVSVYLQPLFRSMWFAPGALFFSLLLGLPL